MAEAGSFFLAEVMLWRYTSAMGVAVIVTIVSTVRSFWLSNKS